MAKLIKRTFSRTSIKFKNWDSSKLKPFQGDICCKDFNITNCSYFSAKRGLEIRLREAENKQNHKFWLVVGGSPLYVPEYFTSVQKQPPEVFCKKGVLRNFAKFIGKQLRQSLFFLIGLQLY